MTDYMLEGWLTSSYRPTDRWNLRAQNWRRNWQSWHAKVYSYRLIT